MKEAAENLSHTPGPALSHVQCDGCRGGAELREGLPRGRSGRESAVNTGDGSLIPGSGRSPGGGNGNPLQDSCLGNPMEKGAWRATVQDAAKESGTTERQNNDKQ